MDFSPSKASPGGENGGLPDNMSVDTSPTRHLPAKGNGKTYERYLSINQYNKAKPQEVITNDEGEESEEEEGQEQEQEKQEKQNTQNYTPQRGGNRHEMSNSSGM